MANEIQNKLTKKFVSSTRGQQERTQKRLQKNRMERC